VGKNLTEWDMSLQWETHTHRGKGIKIMSTVSDERSQIIKALSLFDRKIEDMHLEFQKYHHGQASIMPDWQALEEDLLNFSRRTFHEVVISKNLDRLLFKFQNRKKLWLSWAEEFHESG
jgi:hypothetical protein